MRASVRDLRAHVPSGQKRTNFSYSNVLTCQRRANFSPWRANVPKGLPSFQLRLPEGLRIFQLFSKELYFFTYLIYLYLICFIYLPTSGIRTVDPPPLPPRKTAPRLGLWFWSRLGLVLGLGGNQTIAPEENFPLVRVTVWVMLVLELGDNFPREQLS